MTGGARVSRAGFRVALKKSFLKVLGRAGLAQITSEVRDGRRPSPKRETRALTYRSPGASFPGSNCLAS